MIKLEHIYKSFHHTTILNEKSKMEKLLALLVHQEVVNPQF